jgi:hypothetical protein
VEETFLSAVQCIWDSDIRQTKIVHTAETLVPEPIAFEVEMAIEKLKKTHITGH